MSTNGNTAVASYYPAPATLPAPKMAGRVKFGVIGYGYWGPNVVRNLQSLTEAEITAVCDQSSAARKRVHKTYPNTYVTSDAFEIMTSSDTDAVAIVTPVWTHYALVKAALENGKHVFVEKPF